MNDQYTFKFSSWDDVGTFIDWCEENGVPIDFNRTQRWARVPEDWRLECEHFIETMPSDGGDE
jgi:hypothetical protein